MPDHYVLDGYNVIFAWDHYQKLRAASLDHARDKLVRTMSNFAAMAGCLVTVVYDAHQVKAGLQKRQQRGNVVVYYTAQDETADSLIEKLVGELVNSNRVYVVTSDWDEQRIIFGRGAYRTTPQELLGLINKKRKKTKSYAKTSTPGDNYLENRLNEDLRRKFERWRREK